MRKIDSFFESPVDSELNKRIVKNIADELELNRRSHQIQRKFIIFAPVVTIVAILFVFNFISINEQNQFLNSYENNYLISELIENEDEFIDMVESIKLLEELEYIEQIEVDDA